MAAWRLFPPIQGIIGSEAVFPINGIIGTSSEFYIVKPKYLDRLPDHIGERVEVE